MGLSEVSDDVLSAKHQELCSNLNLDSASTNQAWESYVNIRGHYTLEGDPLHWLACALYVACRKSSAPTVGRSGTVEGNCVSLTRLLRLYDLSLTQFFEKSKKWADMANMSEEFRKKLDSIERNFVVSYLIFKKFIPIFEDIFQNPSDNDEQQRHRSKKPRGPCTPNKFYEFCWTLYVCIKAEIAPCSDDLVNSYNLLLVVCDLTYGNALVANKRDLLNPDFAGLPSDWSSPNYVPPKEPNCILDILCERHDGLPREAKYIKEYTFNELLQGLLEKGTLKGSGTYELFNSAVFDSNIRSVTRAYETHLLNKGDFDERIFIAEYRRLRYMAENSISANADGTFSETGSPRSAQPTADQIQHLNPATPLTGRRALSVTESIVTPLSTATRSVTRLQTLLSGRQPGPSDALNQIFKSCLKDPTESIKTRLDELSDLFRVKYTEQAANQQNAQNDLANQRLEVARTLYYKVLEDILIDEKKKGRDVNVLIDVDIFHKCTFACSLEIVLYSYNSQNKFPWILNTLELDSTYFIRVIELIVRTKDQLSRDVVKHFNSIEEQILDSLAWKSNSQIWNQIEAIKGNIPSNEDTALPGTLSDTPAGAALNYAKEKRILGERTATPSSQQSPGPSAVDRFESPIASNLVKKQLFAEAGIKPGQSLLNKTPTHIVVISEGNKKLIPISDSNLEIIIPQNSNSQNNQNLASAKPKKQGSLAIFFRKFYHCAALRMNDLCDKLEISSNVDLKRKIWTYFESTIMHNIELLRDRHLDQLLMCAVYIMCKVTRNDKTFTDIMNCYKTQPQASSHIYRSVLIKRAQRIESNEGQESNNGTVEPTEMAGTATNHENEQRGDLIKFYNTIYVNALKKFALRFTPDRGDTNLKLSPLPIPQLHMLNSPSRRVANNFIVKPYEGQNFSSPQNVKSLSYFFNRSPPKLLDDINKLINTESASRIGKRLLMDDEEEEASPPKQTRVFQRKIQGLCEDRLIQNKE